jgi:dipeptidyl aminopeptidase/acylaminoacyl peptidase
MSTRRLILFFCVTFFCFCLTASATFGQKQLAPLPVKDALKTLSFSNFTPIELSSDGRLVAYTLSDNARKAQAIRSRSLQELERIGIPRGADYCDIWISDTTTGTAKNLTQGRGTSWSPVWSPNGKYLAFYSDRDGTPGLWLWERSSGTLRKASDAIVRTRLETSLPRWTPDSKRVVIRVLPKGLTLADAHTLTSKPTTQNDNLTGVSKESGSTVTLFRSKTHRSARENEASGLNDYLVIFTADLALVDLEKKSTNRVASRIVAESYWLSPDGTNIAVLVYKGRQSQQNLQAIFDLVVISLEDGRARTLVSSFGSDALIPLSWSPDGKFLAYITFGQVVKNNCWVVPVSGGEPRNVTQGEHPNFDNTLLYRGPLWDASGAYLYLLTRDSLWRASVNDGRAASIATIPQRTIRHVLSNNGRTIWTKVDSAVVVTRDEDTKKEGLYKINLTTGQFEKLLEENKSFGFVPSLRVGVSADQQNLIYTSQSAAEPEEIWTTVASEFLPRQLTHINPIFDGYVMGDGRMIDWQTLNGQKARGALLLPAGYMPGKRYPLIVYQYPGSTWSNYLNLFGFNPFSNAVENWQFFATRGYAVLLADVPAKPETYMKDIAAAVLPGVDKVIELGIADADRVGVTGQSNGGYGVLSLIVQTDRFKAAVDRMGPGNLISQYTQMTEEGVSVYTGEMVQRTGGSLWEKREKFIENSPIFYFDRVKTPLLIVQGTADRQVMVARSDEVFVSLRFLGKEVEYARYGGESHGVSEWSYANQVDYLNRVIAWFDLWLKS